MSAQWLSLQSFQQGQELLEGINNFSIHTKLKRNGIADPKRAKTVQQNREKIKVFLQALAPLVEQAEEKPDKPLLGIDLRRRQLVNRFLEAKRNPRRYRSALFRKSIAEAIRLVDSDAEGDYQNLIECLADLRILIQEHTNRDAARILGEI
jgi:hypothetical protein